MSDSNPVFPGRTSRCWVDAISPEDVLSGRGSGPNDHKGNIRFRKIVKSQKAEYVAASYRPEKKKIAQRVVDVTQENGARFLRRATANEREKLGIPEDIDEAWLLMDDSAVLEKAKQALRQKAGKQQGSVQGSDSFSIGDEMTATKKKPASQRKRSQERTDISTPVPSQEQTLVHVKQQIYDIADNLFSSDTDTEPLDWRTYPSFQTRVEHEHQVYNTCHLEHASRSQESFMTQLEEARMGVNRARADLNYEPLTANTMSANDDESEEEFFDKQFYPFSSAGNSRHSI
jgi:hypothetical protein